MPANLENSAVATGLENVTFHSNAKECSNYHTIVLILHTSKIMLNSKAGFNSMWTVNFQIFKLDLEKAEEPEIKLPISARLLKKQESSRKTSFALLTTPKSLTVWITTNSGKFLKRWEYQTAWPASWEICMQVRKQQLELDMEQQFSFKLGKEYHQGCILSPCLCNFYTEYIMWHAALDETQAGIKIAGRNINDLRYADDNTLMAQEKRNYRASWWKWKRRVKSWFKTQIHKMKIMASGPITSWEIDGKTMETVTDFIFEGLQNHCRWWLQPWN